VLKNDIEDEDSQRKEILEFRRSQRTNKIPEVKKEKPSLRFLRKWPASESWI
jgi:hypothetical protein